MTEQDQGDTELTQAVDTPAPVTAVATATGAPRTSRARWAIALGGAAIVVALTAAVVFALVGRSPDATVLGYVPSGSIAYGEVRLDLPGDQAQKVAQFLSKFPGFADQAALGSKLDETLDRLVKDASDGKQTYTGDIKPWFGGEVAFSVGSLPDPKTITGSADGSGAMPSFHGMAILSLKDATLAKAWFDRQIADSGATTTTEPYNGTTLTLSTQDGQTGAFAIIDGKVAAIGDVATVKAAVDTKGAGGLGNDAGAKAALASTTADHVGFMYLALGPLMDWSSSLSAAMPGGDASASALAAALRAYVPDWAAYSLRFDSDALVLESVSDKPKGTLGPTQDRASDITKHIPSNAIMSAVSHDAGASILQVLDLYRAQPSMKPMIDQLEGGLALVGGVQAATGWIGDTALVIDRTDGGPEGGLVILPTDAGDARKLATSLSAFIAIGGSREGVTIRTVDHGGTTITVVDLDAGQLAGAAGGPATPIPALPTSHVEIAWAITDQLVAIGVGPSFVGHVLDTTDATSLASNDRYRALADRVGNGTGTTFVDVTAIREMVEAAVTSMDPAALKDYDTNVKPYLVPFDALVASNSVGGDMTRSKLVITVR